MFKIGMLIMFLSFMCASAAEPLTWTGCGITKKAFMKEAAKKYQEKTKIAIKITGGGATKGIRSAHAGVTSLGGTCRPALKNRFPDKEGKAKMTVVAWDALVPIVHPNNPLDDISVENLKKILKGEITNWGELGIKGGNSKKKIMFIRRQGDHSGVGFMMRKIFFGFSALDIGKKDPVTKHAVMVKSSGPLEKKVESKQWAIGITGISSAKKRNVKILKINGEEASVEKIASGTYLTFRPLYLATHGTPVGETKKFLDWLLSDEGQAIIESQGTVSLRQAKGLKKKFQHWLHTENILNFSALK